MDGTNNCFKQELRSDGTLIYTYIEKREGIESIVEPMTTGIPSVPTDYRENVKHIIIKKGRKFFG